LFDALGLSRVICEVMHFFGIGFAVVEFGAQFPLTWEGMYEFTTHDSDRRLDEFRIQCVHGFFFPYLEVTARNREYTHEKTSIPKFHGGYGDPGSHARLCFGKS
jgi:hypothetical protein